MKIIGESNGDFIVTITKEEVAKLSGYKASHSFNYTKPKIGDDIDIFNIIRRIETVEEMHFYLQRLLDTVSSVKSILTESVNIFTTETKEINKPNL